MIQTNTTISAQPSLVSTKLGEELPVFCERCGYSLHGLPQTMAVGATTVWPIWTLLVHAFLPKRTATALLNWQLSLSNQVSALSRI